MRSACLPDAQVRKFAIAQVRHVHKALAQSMLPCKICRAASTPAYAQLRTLVG